MDPAAILEQIRNSPGRRATVKQLARRLQLQGPARVQLRHLLRRLASEQALVVHGQAYQLPSRSTPSAAPRKPSAARKSAALPARNTVLGRISLHREGYGFVLPEAEGFTEDIFIPPPFTAHAMHGDRVQVEILRPGPNGKNAKRDAAGAARSGRISGKVIRIAERAQGQIVGLLHKSPAGFYLQPYDDRLPERIAVEKVPDALPGLARHRILGDEAAHASARLDGPGPWVAEVEVTEFGSAVRQPRGRLLEILGQPGDFGIDVEIMIRKHHLPHHFSQAALSEAQSLAGQRVWPHAEMARRRDFRNLPVVTIDGETARDFDDAVLVARAGAGYELAVHIADVAFYVRPGSELDREARLRGTSVYFPGRAVPMLPAELSSDLCSLRPREDRLTLSCLIRLDREGRIESYEIAPGMIRSAARLTYAEVNDWLRNPPAGPARPPNVDLELMLELQRKMVQRRRERGAIDFDLPEAEIAFDELGLMHSIVKSERNDAHRIIEEFMLAANQCVARYLESRSEAAIYRIHEAPDAGKVLAFEEIASGFGYSLGAEISTRAPRRHGLAGGGRAAARVDPRELGAQVKISPRHYQQLTERLAGKPEERILSFLMLRSLRQARYSVGNVGHFALAMPTYTHFTSPIRRYPDLIVHRLLHALLPEGGSGRRLWEERKFSPEKSVKRSSSNTLDNNSDVIDNIDIIASESSQAERRADEAERELMEWKKVRFMEARIGQRFPALILNVTRHGFSLELTDMFIEGFVPLESLDDDRYRFHAAAHELVGERHRRRFRLGDRLEVIVDRIDPVRNRVHFAPADAEKTGRKKKIEP